MPKKRTTFLMQFDWYPMIAQLNTEQKAHLWDVIYHYQLYGEIIDADPLVKMVFIPMLTFFKGSAEDYAKTCIKNSLNKRKGWAEADKDEKRVAFIEEQKRYLEEHTSEEFNAKYLDKGAHTSVKGGTEAEASVKGAIGAYTKDTYTNSNSDSNIQTNTKSGSKDRDYKGKEEISSEEQTPTDEQLYPW